MLNKSRFDIYFQNSFLSKKGTEFEKWFCDMAERVYSTDFEKIKAGGSSGDKKSDGRLVSKELIFQCYAPESSSEFAKNSGSKMRDSFPEVLQYWPKLKKWIFIHNNDQGITSKSSDVLEELRSTYPNITLAVASRSFLKDELHDKLSTRQLLDLYPNAELDFTQVQMKNIRPLLKRIRENMKSAPLNHNFGEIPHIAKIKYNKLSSEAQIDLTRARYNIDIMNRYLSSLSNPQHATDIQNGLSGHYVYLRDIGHTPDEILAGLLKFLGDDGVPANRATAYVILTYYLDACDVFENVPEGWQC